MSNNEEPLLPLELMENIMCIKSSGLCIACAISTYTAKRHFLTMRSMSELRKKPSDPTLLDNPTAYYNTISRKRSMSVKFARRARAITLFSLKE